MTLEKARELLKVQADFGGSYNANGAKLIRELELERVFGFRPGTTFDGSLVAGRKKP